jgi:hypothetical protein
LTIDPNEIDSEAAWTWMADIWPDRVSLWN